MHRQPRLFNRCMVTDREGDMNECAVSGLFFSRLVRIYNPGLNLLRIF
jgi:hypothetical protein